MSVTDPVMVYMFLLAHLQLVPATGLQFHSGFVCIGVIVPGPHCPSQLLPCTFMVS